jgi:protein-tyrosine phosphatase
MIDIHNHILPAWDDGPKTLAETFQMARQAVAGGTTVMVASPHRSWDGTFSHTSRVLERVQQLNDELALEGIPLEIVPGVEIPISLEMMDEVESGQLRPLGSGRHLLVEPPFPNLPDTLIPAVANVFKRGYSAVLAHPERNSVIQKQWSISRDLSFVKACAELGCVIQLTSGSIVGRFGHHALDVAKAIALHREWTIVIASDSHDSRDRTPGFLAEAKQTLARWIDDESAAEAMVNDLPRTIIGR